MKSVEVSVGGSVFLLVVTGCPDCKCVLISKAHILISGATNIVISTASAVYLMN